MGGTTLTSLEKSNLTFEQVMNYDSQYVFEHINTSEIFTKTKIRQLIKKATERGLLDKYPDYKEKFASLLVPRKAWHIRNGKRHHLSCEYGYDPQACVCWCGGKFHGWNCKEILK